jgi:hypothetical protein
VFKTRDEKKEEKQKRVLLVGPLGCRMENMLKQKGISSPLLNWEDALLVADSIKGIKLIVFEMNQSDWLTTARELRAKIDATVPIVFVSKRNWPTSDLVAAYQESGREVFHLHNREEIRKIIQLAEQILNLAKERGKADEED